MSNFSENLTRLHKESLMSISELSRRSGVSRRQIYTLMKGETKPSLTTIGCLARALGVEVRELMEERC